MTIAHSALTGADLHEPKGAAAASINTHYKSNGAGSGTWAKLVAAEVDTSSIFSMNTVYLTTSFTDVSTAEIVYLVVPFTGTLTNVYTALQLAITGADSIVTVKNNAGSSAGTITVAFSGSAPGDIDTLAPSVNNTFTSGQIMTITTDGASSTASRLFVTLKFTITA